MKRNILALSALLSLIVGYAQLNGYLPIGSESFIDECPSSERLMSADKHDPSYREPQYAPTRVINGVEMADAFIGIDDTAAIATLKGHGVIVNCEFDGFVTAQIPVKLLSTISSLPGVTDVEISRMVKLATDSTLSLTRAGLVLNGTQNGLPKSFDGSGVVIGIIDNGFDYQHLAFKCSDDSTRTRIVRVYDPQDSTGHEVRVGNNVLPGSVFMGAQIDTLTHDFGSNSAHGTHVAGIAAGRHVNGYGGMAPGAELVMCVCRNLQLLIPETEVANSIKYIYSYADSVGKPCVISVSVSTNFGPHDGSDRISQAIAQTTGPGHIFVIAAGNTGSRNFYTYGPTTLDNPLYMLYGTQSEGYYRYDWFDTWVRIPNTRPVVQFHIFDTSTKHIVWESELITLFKKINASQISQYFEPDVSVDGDGYLSALISLTSSRKYELKSEVYNLKSKHYFKDSNGNNVSRYRIGLTVFPPKINYPSQTDSIYIDSWVVQGSLSSYGGVLYDEVVTEYGDTLFTPRNGHYCWPDDNSSIGSYAVHDSIISAGSYAGRNSFYSWALQSMQYDNTPIGSIYNTSSYQTQGFGPTGKALPTVMAPGYNVVSSVSRYSNYNTGIGGYPYLVMRYGNGDYLWGVMSGTSMAAPTVAGIIAQWLQLKPSLSPGEIKEIIAQTAIKDSYTLNPNNGKRFGPNGKIDAMAGIRYILDHMAEEYKLGDVNGNGVVDISDVVMLIAFIVHDGSGNEPEINRINSDMDVNGRIDISDVRILISMIVNDDGNQ